MGHAVLEWIAAFRAKEVTVVPVLSKRHDVFSQNRGLAVLAPRRKELMPVQVAVEPKAVIAVLGHRLPRFFVEYLPGCPARDALESLVPERLGLWADL
jgi:hypothetical protein